MHAVSWASLLGPRLHEFDRQFMAGKVLRPVVELTDNLQDALEAIADRSACIVSFSWRNMFCTASVKLILGQSLCLTVNDDCSLLQLKVLDQTSDRESRNL